MERFIQQHRDCVRGWISGWDRLRFRGTIRMLANVKGMYHFLCYTGHLLKDFGQHALSVSRQVRAASLAAAEASGRPVIHLSSPSICKEDRAREVEEHDGINGGLVCVLTATEGCGSYNIRSNRERGELELFHDYRKCQHLYHYMIHPLFGRMHVRLQTWFPFNLHVCVNGREWLARQMESAGLSHKRADNCFTAIEDLTAAQILADQQVRFDWAQALGELVPQVNPLLPSIVQGYQIGYYWSLDQSEWATDVMFNNRQALDALYPALLRHGMGSFGSPEVMRFMGRSVEVGITPRFSGEIVSDIASRPDKYEGLRIKHRINRNSVKMYNKAGNVLRVETTLNDMRDIQTMRVKNGRKQWTPMRKGVTDMPRRAEVSQKSNERYLDALADVSTPMPLKTLTDKLSKAVTWKGKRLRGLNLLSEDDSALLSAAGRGEFLINGLRNRDLQRLLFAKSTKDPVECRRRCGQVTRKLRMLRAHGLIHKVPHTHRYMVSQRGRQLIAALHAAREADINTLANAA